MGPTRSNTSTKSQKQGFKHKGEDLSSHDSLPGVQKIKASLRQTRRLLAKENLAADVRIETERRLKSLEGDLAKAEHTRKERNLAVRYHKIKFFERQKVCRKIKHAKKLLDTPDLPPECLPSLRETLLSHRVDLNYILHYPKLKKYISLFPPESSKGSSKSSETDLQRDELRQWVRTAMKSGEMDSEPEERMDKGARDQSTNWTEEASNLSKRARRKGLGSSKSKGIPGDAFFEESGEDEDGSDEG